MTDVQELHWINKPKLERICATSLAYTAQTVYLLELESRADLDHVTLIYTAPGDRVKKAVEIPTESTSLSNHVRSIQIQRRILLKLQISEQMPLIWKPGKTLFNKHRSSPFTIDLTVNYRDNLWQKLSNVFE